MSSILGPLGATPAADTAPAPQAMPATPAAAPADATAKEQTPSSAEAIEKFPVLVNIVTGKVPGVLIPKNFPAQNTPGLSPQTLSDVGIGVYKPFSKDYSALLFDPGKVSVDHLQKLDKAGTLGKYFPSLDSIFPGAQGSDSTTAGGKVDTTEASASGAPMTRVLPKSTFDSNAQTQAATERLKQVMGNVQPSKRQIPGGGTVLNGLLPQAA